MTTTDQKQLKEELKKCLNLKEIVSTMDQYYILDKELGMMSKAAVIRGLDDVIQMCGIKER